MAYSAADLSANELTWAAADKPILGHNAAANALSDSRWTATATGTFASGDISDSDYPISRLFDGLPGLKSQPASTQTAYTICLDFGSSGIEFDGILYLAHNLQSEDCSALELDIADDNAFTTNKITISSLSPSGGSSDARLADLVLESGGGTARRYSSVRWARITMVKGTNFDPAIGQVIFLRRRQLQYNPDRVWDPANQRSSVDTFESRSGVDYDTVRYRGRRTVDADLEFHTEAERNDLLAWWTATRQGTEKLIWIDEPTTTPAGFFFGKLREPRFQFPWTEWSQRSYSLMAEEQGPDFLELE